MAHHDDAGPLPAAEAQPARAEPQQADVAQQIERASDSVPMAGAAGAALRSMLISAVIIGGGVWLARLLLGRKQPRDGNEKNG